MGHADCASVALGWEAAKPPALPDTSVRICFSLPAHSNQPLKWQGLEWRRSGCDFAAPRTPRPASLCAANHGKPYCTVSGARSATGKLHTEHGRSPVFRCPECHSRTVAHPCAAAQTRSGCARRSPLCHAAAPLRFAQAAHPLRQDPGGAELCLPLGAVLVRGRRSLAATPRHDPVRCGWRMSPPRLLALTLPARAVQLVQWQHRHARCPLLPPAAQTLQRTRGDAQQCCCAAGHCRPPRPRLQSRRACARCSAARARYYVATPPHSRYP